MTTIRSYTTIEQSRKLAEILPLETADMCYRIVAYNPNDTHEYQPYCFSGTLESDIPCWSLAALLGVIKEQGLVDLRFLQSTYDNRGNRLTNVWCCTFENLGTVSLDLYADNPVDACVEMIEYLHELKML